MLIILYNAINDVKINNTTKFCLSLNDKFYIIHFLVQFTSGEDYFDITSLILQKTTWDLSLNLLLGASYRSLPHIHLNPITVLSQCHVIESNC